MAEEEGEFEPPFDPSFAEDAVRKAADRCLPPAHMGLDVETIWTQCWDHGDRIAKGLTIRLIRDLSRIDVDLDTEDIKEVYSLRLWLEVHERYFCDLDLDVALAQNDYGFMHDLGIDFALITREGGGDILHGEVGGLPIRCPMVRYEDLNVALFDCRDATTGEAVCTVTLRNTEYH